MKKFFIENAYSQSSVYTSTNYEKNFFIENQNVIVRKKNWHHLNRIKLHFLQIFSKSDLL